MAVLSPTPPAFIQGAKAAERGHSLQEALVEHLETQEREELAIIRDYELAAAQSGDAELAFRLCDLTQLGLGVRHLIGLVLEDERRHHQQNETRADNLRWTLPGQHNEIPFTSTTACGPGRQELLAQTERFLELEHDCECQLVSLHRKLLGERQSGLMAFVLELLADTDRHIRVLQDIQKSLTAR